MELRPYQLDALKAIRDNYTKGVHRQAISASTCTGKTVIYAEIPRVMKDLLPGQTLALAHRTELIDQNIEKLQQANPTLRVGKEMAGDRVDVESEIIVASVQTLGRLGTKRIDRFNWDNIDKVISDELHHAAGDSYKRIYEKAGVLNKATNKLHVGVSATINRADGKALHDIFDAVVYDYSLRQAITDNWLVDIKGIRVTTKTSLDDVKTVAGDFDQGELANTVNTTQRNQLVAKSILEHAKDRQIIVFCVDIAHSKDMAEMLRNCGLDAEAIWGIDGEREDKIRRFKEQKLKILTNCNVLTEGFDCPSVSCVVLARPTKSPVFYIQTIGRGTRLSPDKKDLLVLDLVDSSSRHSLITLPTLFGLNARLNLQGGSLLGATRKLEDAQSKYSHLDFTGLVNIDELEAYIESVDLFNVTYPEEVETNSELTWHRAVGGGYILLLNKEEKLQIQENLLGQWEVSASIGGRRYRGSRDALGEAFRVADELIHTQAPDVLKIVKREGERWHNDPATPAQLKLLAKLLKGKKIPPDIDKKTASQVISSFFAKK